MRLLLLVLLLSLAGWATPHQVHAQVVATNKAPHTFRWSAPELALAAIFATTMWIDAAQTREALRTGYYERNPILGVYPSASEINLYGITASLVVVTTAAVLPRPWRSVVLMGATALEVRTIVRSTRIGLRIRL